MSISKHLTISLIQLLEQSERLHSFRKRPSIFFHEKKRKHEGKQPNTLRNGRFSQDNPFQMSYRAEKINFYKNTTTTGWNSRHKINSKHSRTKIFQFLLGLLEILSE